MTVLPALMSVSTLRFPVTANVFVPVVKEKLFVSGVYLQLLSWYTAILVLAMSSDTVPLPGVPPGTEVLILTVPKLATRLPPLTLPTAAIVNGVSIEPRFATPELVIFPTEILPVTVRTDVDLLKVKLELALIVLLSLS